jgi:hypothetical protein
MAGLSFPERAFAAHESSFFLKSATVRLISASTSLHRELAGAEDGASRALAEFNDAVDDYHAAISRAMAELDDPDDWPLPNGAL